MADIFTPIRFDNFGYFFSFLLRQSDTLKRRRKSNQETYQECPQFTQVARILLLPIRPANKPTPANATAPTTALPALNPFLL